MFSIHVFDFLIREIHRVLKSEGSVLLTVPMLWGEHEKPRDCARYTSFGIRRLMERNGFTVTHQRKVTTGVRALFALACAGIYERVACRSSKTNIVAALLCCIPLNISGAILHWLIPTTEDIYLDNIILGKKCKEQRTVQTIPDCVC